MTNTRNLLIRKYIIDIIFVVVVISLLTWFWFGPYQHKVRIRESLEANNIDFNKDIAYTGFDYLELSSNKITKDLTVTNDSDEEISFIINFNNLTGDNSLVYLSLYAKKKEKYYTKIIKVLNQERVLNKEFIKNEFIKLFKENIMKEL